MLMDKRLTALVVATVATLLPVKAQSDDFGVWLDAGVTKKINRKWSIDAEAGLRTRDNSKEFDRWSVGVAANYKLTSFLKASVGYDLLVDHRELAVTYHKNGHINKITPEYWWPRHRLSADLTGSMRFGRLGLSLRERYQLTYRAEATGKKFDADTREWGSVKSKTSHLLRSRLQASWHIRKCPFTPQAGVELFTGNGGLQKTRWMLGTAYSLDKHHELKLAYRYQTVNGDDDDEPGTHVLGVGYTYKF